MSRVVKLIRSNLTVSLETDIDIEIYKGKDLYRQLTYDLKYSTASLRLFKGKIWILRKDSENCLKIGGVIGFC